MKVLSDMDQSLALSSPRTWLRLSLLGSAMLLSACNLRPDPITQDQHIDRAVQDYQVLKTNYIPLEKR